MKPRLLQRLDVRVAGFLRRTGALRPGDRVLAAVSGGPDSTALLLALAALRGRLGIEVAAAHFDHQLRGRRASAAERAAVRALCERAGVELAEGAGDVRAEARRTKRGIEETARRLRYEFLRDAAKTGRCGVVATGHTLDDQAETVLLNVARGAGLRGLAAMRARSPWPLGGDGPGVARPLLGLRREDTRAYCDAAGVTPIDDPTNRQLQAARNRVRHELLPALRRFNPKIEEALTRLAEASAEAEDILEALAAAALETAQLEPGRAGLLLAPLRDMPPALRHRALRAAVERASGSAEGFGDRVWRAMAAAVDAPAGTTLDLPRGLRLEVGYDELAVRKGRHRKPARLAPVELKVPGEARFGRWRFRAGGRARRRASEEELVAVLDARAVDGTLTIRARRPGDRFQPSGMRVAKKLQDFFVDAKVARAERDSVPLVESSRGIVWVVGLRVAEWAKPKPRGRKVELRAWQEPPL